MWATLEQPGVPTGVQKDEMCVFIAPAHNKKRPSGKVVIMRFNIIWHKLRMRRACAQQKGTGGVQVTSRRGHGAPVRYQGSFRVTTQSTRWPGKQPDERLGSSR